MGEVGAWPIMGVCGGRRADRETERFVRGKEGGRNGRDVGGRKRGRGREGSEETQ